MANKIISNLTPKTSPAADDVLAIEDTEATKKIDYNALADAILNKLTSKTYSVAGSTQTLISAIDALNSNSYSLKNSISIASNTDLNTLITPGNYTSANSSVTSTLVNSPISNLGFAMKVEYVNNTFAVLQTIITRGSSPSRYERTCAISGGVVTFDSDWKRVPTRSEVDTLNNRFVSEYWAAGTTSKTYSLTARKAYLLVASNMSSTQNPVNTHISIVQAGTNASATPAVYTLVNGSYWTVTAEANNTITVTGVYAYDQVSLIQL